MKRLGFKLIAQTAPVLSLLIVSASTHAQSGRSTPGQNLGSNSTPGAAAPQAASSPGGSGFTPATNAKGKPAAAIGDYVALDDSVKNEIYGTIDFPNAELKDIIRAISKLANKNFILDKKIEGRKITILSPEPVTKQEAYNAFLSALYANDFTIVSVGTFLKVIDAKNAIQSNVRVFVGDYAPNNEEIVTVIYPLKYLDAEEIQRFLTDLVPRNARITNYPNTNTLVMTDTGLNLRRVISVLKSVDVPGYEDQLETIPIRYASAKGVAQLVDSILDAQSGGAASRRRSRPGNQVQKTRGGGVITKIVPDDRTNSIVVLANGRGVKEIRDLIAKLDTPNAAGGGNIHIYYCKNAVAEELAATISSLISGATPKANTNANPNGPANGPIPSPIFNPVAASNNSGSRGGGDGVSFEGQVKVTADKPTNSLVIIASGSDYTALKNVLKQLDIAQRQVYVEATIMEIKVEDGKKFGVATNIAAPGFAQAGGFNPVVGVPDIAALVSSASTIQGLVSTITAGKRVTVNVGGNSVQLPTVSALINAVQTSGQGNILNQPQILTSDNKEALIEIKDNIPVDTGSTRDANNNLTINTGREDVVVSLKITPQIGSDNNLIKLKVEQQIDDFTGVTTAAGGNISRTSRKANTTVTIKDGGTIVVGGLQKVASNDKSSKIPILGDLPIIGMLFKGTDGSTKKSNLVLFLTPHVINNYSDLQRITQAKVNERYEFGKTQYEPKDRLSSRIKKIKDQIDAEAKTGGDVAFGFKPQDTDKDDESKSSDKATEKLDNEKIPSNDELAPKVEEPATSSYIQTSPTPPPTQSKAAPPPSSATTTVPEPLLDQSVDNPEALEEGQFLGAPNLDTDSVSPKQPGNGQTPARAR